MALAFAIIEHSQSYYDFYGELLAHIQQNFQDVQSGVQGDAWIWIFDGDNKVAVDTFYSMQFEINSDTDNALLHSVIRHIGQKYTVRIYEEPRAF